MFNLASPDRYQPSDEDIQEILRRMSAGNPPVREPRRFLQSQSDPSIPPPQRLEPVDEPQDPSISPPRRIIGESPTPRVTMPPPTRVRVDEDAPPTRTNPSLPYDDPNVDLPPERAPLAGLPPPPTRIPTLTETPTVEPPIRNAMGAGDVEAAGVAAPERDPNTAAPLSDPLLNPPTRLDPRAYRQGVSTAGMSDLDAAQARLRAVQGASAQSRINTDDPNFLEVEPPHGISRLKAMGRLFLHNLTHGGGLIGGLIGAGEGLIAPGHAQDLKHEQEVAEAQGNLDQTFSNAKTSAQIEDIKAQAQQRLHPKLEPPHEDFRVIGEGEYPGTPAGTAIKRIWDSKQGKFVDEVNDKGEPTIRSVPPLRTKANPDLKERVVNEGEYPGVAAGTKIFRDANTGQDVMVSPGKPWVAGAAPDDKQGASEAYQTNLKNAERKAKADAADIAAKTAHGKAETYRQQEAAERAKITQYQGYIDDQQRQNDAMQARIKSGQIDATAGGAELARISKLVDAKELRKQMKVSEAEAERLKGLGQKHDDIEAAKIQERDEFKVPLPAPPTRTKGPTSQYAGQPWSLGKWRTNNPSATPEQEATAKAKAVNAQMKVVD